MSGKRAEVEIKDQKSSKKYTRILYSHLNRGSISVNNHFYLYLCKYLHTYKTRNFCHNIALLAFTVR